jgi:hypothetical protein
VVRIQTTGHSEPSITLISVKDLPQCIFTVLVFYDGVHHVRSHGVFSGEDDLTVRTEDSGLVGWRLVLPLEGTRAGAEGGHGSSYGRDNQVATIGGELAAISLEHTGSRAVIGEDLVRPKVQRRSKQLPLGSHIAHAQSKQESDTLKAHHDAESKLFVSLVENEIDTSVVAFGLNRRWEVEDPFWLVVGGNALIHMAGKKIRRHPTTAKISK